MKRFLLLPAALFAALLCSNVLGAGFVPQDAWQRITPVGESFSVLMPTSASEGSRRVPLDTENTTVGRVYFCLAAGKRYLVMSFAKTKPEWHGPLESFDTFVLGIERSLKSPENSFVFERGVPSEGSQVRQYRVTMGRYSGVARLIGKENSFYAVVLMGAEATSAEADRFFSSFTPGPVNSESNNVIVDTERYLDFNAISKSGGELPPEPWPLSMSPISGGVLNGKALSLPLPEYPSAARQLGDSGDVSIWIVIDEQGKVIAAKAKAGPKSLQGAALAAAWKSRFSPTRLSGQPMKVRGQILYYFAP